MMGVRDDYIGNMRKDIPGVVVRVDRATPLGNPFKMSIESERDDVCDNMRSGYMNRWKMAIKM